LLAALPAAAQDSADAVGFGDDTALPLAPVAAPAQEDTPSRWSFAGWLRTQLALRLERAEPSRLAKLRSTLGAELGYRRDLSHAATVRAVASGRLEYDLAYELHRSHWDEATLDTYELRLIPGELFAALQLESFELSTGKQIVNLGQGEVLSVLDTVSPRDQREPAAADPEELRLSVLMTRASLSSGAHRAELIVVHEPHFGLLPPPLGELSGLRKVIADQAGGAVLASRELSYRHVPDRAAISAQSTQAYARMTLVGEGFDLAFLAASLLDPIGVAGLPEPGAFAEQDIELIVHHPRFTRFGHSGAVPFSSFVLRWELAFDAKRPLSLLDTSRPFERMTSVRRDQLSGLLGLSYVPTPSTSAALELQQSHVLDHPARKDDGAREPLMPIEAPQLALRVDHTFLRDRAALQLVLLLVGIEPFNAFVARGLVDYELTPGLRAGVGFICYAPSATELGPFYGLGGADRAFAQLRWDFAP
jgi:hypothetical protein